MGISYSARLPRVINGQRPRANNDRGGEQCVGDDKEMKDEHSPLDGVLGEVALEGGGRAEHPAHEGVDRGGDAEQDVARRQIGLKRTVDETHLLQYRQC